MCIRDRYIPGGNGEKEYSPSADAIVRNASLVAALTTSTGTLTKWPSGSVMVPEIVPADECCAIRLAVKSASRSSHCANTAHWRYFGSTFLTASRNRRDARGLFI